MSPSLMPIDSTISSGWNRTPVVTSNAAMHGDRPANREHREQKRRMPTLMATRPKFTSCRRAGLPSQGAGLSEGTSQLGDG
jgi:hypothetical protein